MFEGHQGPITGIHCHAAVGAVDFSHLFVTSSFDWTVKLWTTKVSEIQLSLLSVSFLTQGGALVLQGKTQVLDLRCLRIVSQYIKYGKKLHGVQVC